MTMQRLSTCLNGVYPDGRDNDQEFGGNRPSETGATDAAPQPPSVPPRRAAVGVFGPDEYEVTLLDLATAQLIRMPISAAARLPLAEALPIRKSSQYRTARHFPGKYFFEKTGSLVPYESQLELKALVRLDFDSAVRAVAAQPFELHFPAAFEAGESHIPDFFCECVGEADRIVDVKPRERLLRPKTRAVFAETEVACAGVGWRHVVMSEPVGASFANVSWLSAFRRSLFDPDELASVLDACSEPLPFAEVESRVGLSRFTRPLIFHLLWHHELETDLTAPLSEASLLSVPTIRPNRTSLDPKEVF